MDSLYAKARPPSEEVIDAARGAKRRRGPKAGRLPSSGQFPRYRQTPLPAVPAKRVEPWKANPVMFAGKPPSIRVAPSSSERNTPVAVPANRLPPIAAN
jgi:hypothetical protein